MNLDNFNIMKINFQKFCIVKFQFCTKIEKNPYFKGEKVKSP